MFHVGQKVVCVVDFGKNFWGIICPVKDDVYTIRDFTEIGKGSGLRLVEIINDPVRHANYPEIIEPSFPVRAFRPVVERKTDISIFKKMLTPTQEPACTSS